MASGLVLGGLDEAAQGVREALTVALSVIELVLDGADLVLELAVVRGRGEAARAGLAFAPGVHGSLLDGKFLLGAPP